MRYMILVLCLGMIVPNIIAKEKINSVKAEQEIIIDGEMSEWTGERLNHFFDKSISVGVRNDENNLYLMLATRNERSMGLLEHAGLTIWINGKNKSKKKIGFQFFGDAGEVYQKFKEAKKQERKNDPRRRGERKAEENDNFNNRKEEMKGLFKVTAEENEYLIKADGSVGAAFVCGMHKDVYLVEIKIPFEQKLMDSSVSLRPKKNKIAIGLEWNVDKDAMKKRMQRDGADMLGSGHGGGGGRGGMGGSRGGSGKGGGSMGGGGRTGGMNSIIEIYEDFWFTIVLPSE